MQCLTVKKNAEFESISIQFWGYVLLLFFTIPHLLVPTYLPAFRKLDPNGQLKCSIKYRVSRTNDNTRGKKYSWALLGGETINGLNNADNT